MIIWELGVAILGLYVYEVVVWMCRRLTRLRRRPKTCVPAWCGVAFVVVCRASDGDVDAAATCACELQCVCECVHRRAAFIFLIPFSFSFLYTVFHDDEDESFVSSTMPGGARGSSNAVRRWDTRREWVIFSDSFLFFLHFTAVTLLHKLLMRFMASNDISRRR